VPSEGVNFFLADGVAAGQEVFHVHLHVIPRTPGDGFRLKARPRSPGRDELDATAERVRAGMSRLPG
jgi:diadenosine tetraphosphate (Ap4A) HIT family hydrolase